MCSAYAEICQYVLFIAFGAVAVAAEHLAILLNRFPAFGPRHDVVGFHFVELQFASVLRTVYSDALMSLLLIDLQGCFLIEST